MSRNWVIGIAIVAAIFATWQWGTVAALPYLALLACPLMCVVMGAMAFRGMGQSPGTGKQAVNSEQADPRA